MSKYLTYEITITDPTMLGHDEDEHELTFLHTMDGGGWSSGNVIHLTDDELKMLFRVTADRINKTIPAKGGR